MGLYDGGKLIVTMVAGSLLGFLYVLLLPVAWIIAAPVLLVKHLVVGTAGAAKKSTAFGWRPTEAYLTGEKKNKKADKEKSEKDG